MLNLILYLLFPLFLLFSKGYLFCDEELIIILCIVIVLYTLIWRFGSFINDNISSISLKIYMFYRQKLEYHNNISISIIEILSKVKQSKLKFFNICLFFFNNIYLLISIIKQLQFIYLKVLVLEFLFNFGIEEKLILMELKNYKSQLFIKKMYQKIAKIYLNNIY